MSRTTRDWTNLGAEFWSRRPYCATVAYPRVRKRKGSKMARRIGIHVERRQASAEIRREVATL